MSLEKGFLYKESKLERLVHSCLLFGLPMSISSGRAFVLGQENVVMGCVITVSVVAVIVDLVTSNPLQICKIDRGVRILMDIGLPVWRQILRSKGNRFLMGIFLMALIYSSALFISLSDESLWPNVIYFLNILSIFRLVAKYPWP